MYREDAYVARMIDIDDGSGSGGTNDGITIVSPIQEWQDEKIGKIVVLFFGLTRDAHEVELGEDGGGVDGTPVCE